MSWLVETLLASAVLMALVLFIRKPVAKAFGARAAYALWALPALRMVMPPIPEWVGAPPLTQLPMTLDIVAIELAPIAAARAVDWGATALTLWLTGAALVTGWQLLAYHRFVTAALRSADGLPEMDADGIEVCASPMVAGPFAAGLLNPTIVLPGDWRTRYSPAELALALRHERVHHQRGDIGVNLVALAVLAVHWWNPLAWAAWRAFRADQELACDAVVLDGADADTRHDYGAALVKSACAATPVAACALNPRDQLKRRLVMLRGGSERRTLGRALAVLLTGGGLVLTASGGIAAETSREVQAVVASKVAPVIAVMAPEPPAPPVHARRPEHPVAPRAPRPPVVTVDPDAAVDAALAATANDSQTPPAPPVPPEPAIALRAPRDCRNMLVVSEVAAASSVRSVRIAMCAPEIDPAKVRRLSIQAIERAREGLMTAQALRDVDLNRVLSELDAELARLRAPGPTI